MSLSGAIASSSPTGRPSAPPGRKHSHKDSLTEIKGSQEIRKKIAKRNAKTSSSSGTKSICVITILATITLMMGMFAVHHGSFG